MKNKRGEYERIDFINGANEFDKVLQKLINGNYDEWYIYDVARGQSWEKKALEIWILQ